jgi:threonylcarbamoyladenosine tRNA methylthiotransferase MtaB
MARFTIDFLGCKVSHVDAREIRERLLADGHAEAPRTEAADVAVINACCVTNEAVAKSRKAAARAARTHGRVYVTGCGANLAGDAFANLPENVTVVARRSEETPAAIATDIGAPGCHGVEARIGRVRAFLKIQDGCSFHCSYCVVPLVRGESRSRTVGAIFAEAERRIAQGHRELVLTGINLGCFKSDGYDLARLVQELAALPDVARVRLSSIEINHVNDELLAVMQGTPKVARHLHVPLQSGDDGVLRAMRRHYDIATYERRLAGLDGAFNLTTDVIVGFPTEDELAFANTLGTVERLGFTRVHVFPYSPRPGTTTAGDDSVPTAVKRERGARLRTLSSELERQRWATKLGSHDVVLVDRPGRGYGDDYTPFLVDAPIGELVRVRAVDVTKEGILARAA